MTTTVRRVLFLLALLGFVTALISARVHYQATHQPGFTSFCDVNATISCTTVYLSRYSTVAGFPVAIMGAFWYLFVLLLLAASRWGRPPLPENVPGYIFALATVGLGAVLYLGYAAFFVIKAVCLLCVATYVAVTGIFLLSGARTSYPMTSLPRRALRDLRAVIGSPVALVTSLVFIAALTTTLAFYPRGAQATPQAQPPAGQTAEDRQSEFVRGWENAPRLTVPVSAEGAAVLIVKFSDFQCPACAQSYLDYKDILAKYNAEYPGAIKFVTKDYPLERECNSNMPRDLHESACESAAAVRLARLRGKGDAMEDWLYRNHSMLTPMAVRQAAKEIADVQDFDLQYPSVLNQVETDIALATVLGIRVTPTFFINGVKLEGELPPQLFDTAILMELKKAGKVK